MNTISFSELQQMALAVRNHYDDLQIANGQKKWKSSERMAGFVADVGDLSKLIMIKNNLRVNPFDQDIDELLAHELSDCLWSIMVLADELDINLEEEFTKNITQLQQRIEKEKKEAEA